MMMMIIRTCSGGERVSAVAPSLDAELYTDPVVSCHQAVIQGLLDPEAVAAVPASHRHQRLVLQVLLPHQQLLLPEVHLPDVGDDA